MESFEKIEKDYSQMPIDYIRDGDVVSGVLSLDGKNTEIILSSDKPLSFQRDDSGWFDFSVKAANGKKILLHNALMSNGTTYYSYGSNQQCKEHFFPNIVVINSDKLASGNKVKSVNFQLSGLSAFFHYRHVDNAFLSGLSTEHIDFLRRILKKKKDIEDIFEPSEIYVVHHPQEAFQLIYEKDQYSVSFSASFEGCFGDGIKCAYQPVAEIIFNEEKSIDDALDAIWNWKRFFSQLAMVDLFVTAISFRGTDKPIIGEPSALVYLPNERSSDHFQSKGASLHPGNIPFNFWEDREKLKTVLSCWLSKNEERKSFRNLLSWIIKEMDKRVSPTDILILCSAIEKLDELAVGGLPSKENIQILVDGAMEAAQVKNVDIKRDRIQSILGMLGKSSLPQKLQSLMDRVSAFVSEDDANILIKYVHSIRVKVAHGDFIQNPNMPLVGPVSEALAGVCALFDLLDCGVPLEPHPAELICPAQKIKVALVELKRLAT